MSIFSQANARKVRFFEAVQTERFSVQTSLSLLPVRSLSMSLSLSLACALSLYVSLSLLPVRSLSMSLSLLSSCSRGVCVRARVCVCVCARERTNERIFLINEGKGISTILFFFHPALGQKQIQQQQQKQSKSK